MIQEKINQVYEGMKKELEELKNNSKVKPCIAIINTNKDDEPSQRYIRNKCKKCNENGIETIIYEPQERTELFELLYNLNHNSKITSIIIQYPFANWLRKYNQDQQVFDIINPEKDIDRLHSKWYYDKDIENLPLTAYAIRRVLNLIDSKKENRILFYGNGITTNKRLFLQMFDEGKFDCRIINSKTPEHSKKELIHWSDIIVSGIGKKDSLECIHKTIICPSIIKNEDGTFSSDLKDELRTENDINSVIGSIGKLTTTALMIRAYKQANSLD